MTEASKLPKRILVPIDFSPSSHKALEAATELAEKFHAAIILVHVVPGHPALNLVDSINEAAIITEAKAYAEERFQTSKAALEGKKIAVQSFIEVDNDVAGSILEIMDREKADLIVISTHGVSGWYPSVFGSTTQKLVKLADVPLMLLRTEKPESTATFTGGRLMEWW